MLYYAQGSALLTADEIFDPSVFDPMTNFFKGLDAGSQPESVTLPTGDLTVDNVVQGFDAGLGTGLVPFKEIGVGKPLTVMIREVYTGKHPKNFFNTPEDMLVTSAIKSIAVLNAKPRALNFLKNKITKKSRMERPGATEEGTPIVFYSPALLEKSMTLDLTMAFDSFDQSIFNQIGDAFTAAAGIPIFLSKSFYLIAGGMIIKMAAQLAEKIIDNAPEFNSSDPLDLQLPGKPPLPAGFVLVTSDDVGNMDPTFAAKHRVNESGTVVEIASGQQYTGDVPYIVFSVDGTEQEELNSFTPTAVSATVLSNYFSMKDGASLSLEILINALKLYNDITYRRQIDQIDEQISKLPAGDPKIAELEKKKAALQKNILEELLKPKSS